jgi:hypothetical protein
LTTFPDEADFFSFDLLAIDHILTAKQLRKCKKTPESILKGVFSLLVIFSIYIVYLRAIISENRKPKIIIKKHAKKIKIALFLAIPIPRKTFAAINNATMIKKIISSVFIGIFSCSFVYKKMFSSCTLFYSRLGIMSRIGTRNVCETFFSTALILCHFLSLSNFTLLHIQSFPIAFALFICYNHICHRKVNEIIAGGVLTRSHGRKVRAP